MRLHSALTSIFLFVSVALSGPLRERDQPQIPYYNDRLAGAYWEETDGAFDFATATFNVPAPSGQHGYSVFVSIDGIKCNSWFTAGITSSVTDGKTTYKAWSEWANYEIYPANLAIAPKDVIRASLNVLSATSGVAILENLNNKQTSVQQFNTTWPLCSRIAAWGAAISDSEIGKPIPFDTVDITNAKAYGPSQEIYEAAGARGLVISHGRAAAVTSVTTEGSSITIKRVHEYE